MSSVTASESSKNLSSAAHGAEAHLEEAWFAEPPPSTRRPSSIPPSQQVKVGEFLGDPDVDSWLR